MAASVICFLDNDILLKLSAFELLDEAIADLQVSPENLRVLDSAEFVFRGNRTVSQGYSQEVRERAIAFVKNCPTVNATASDEFIVLSGLVDVGEATLIAATQNESSFMLLTGDKRCLVTLVMREELAEVRARLQGRVICLEQMILLLIRRLGFEAVRTKVVPVMACDTAITACFGSGELATEANVVMALEGYITDLKRDAEGLLADLSKFYTKQS
jgi:hypothetical protein